METEEQLLNLFLHYAGLEKPTPESVTIGYTLPKDNKNGMDGVMKEHVTKIDFLLASVRDDKLRKQLLSVRGFTFSEYLQLFNLNIREGTFHDFAAFRYLGINEDKMRRRLILQLTPTHEDYCRFLVRCLLSHNAPHLPTFFFPESYTYSHIAKLSYVGLWKNWVR